MSKTFANHHNKALKLIKSVCVVLNNAFYIVSLRKQKFIVALEYCACCICSVKMAHMALTSVHVLIMWCCEQLMMHMYFCTPLPFLSTYVTVTLEV